MTSEEKDLLLKDLCGRLPYYTLVYLSNTMEGFDSELSTAEIEFLINNEYMVKPYLFPLSNITEEQKKDLLLTVVGKEGLKLFSVTKDGIVSNDKSEQSLYNFSFNNVEFSNDTTEAYIDWLNKNHFDYRGLIDKGLAIDATGLNIYKEETK